jgi:DNA-binding NtrC family response regulator
MCSGPAIVHDGVIPDTSIAPGALPDAPATASGCFAVAKAEAVRRFERDYLRRVLDECGGNVSRAARIAGKERRAFGKLLKKYGIATHAEHAVQGG